MRHFVTRSPLVVPFLAMTAILPCPVECAEPLPADTSFAAPDPVRMAVERGLARVTQAAARWHANKTCFTCHHQTPSVLAAREAERAGFPLDRMWLAEQTQHTLNYFTPLNDGMRTGEHVPGGAASVAYGLWALELAEHAPDETTTAMVANLLRIQGVVRLKGRQPDARPKIEDGRWEASCRRAPMQGSLAGDTVLSLLGVVHYAATGQPEEVSRARAAAEAYLDQFQPRDQQDRLWKLWGIVRLEGAHPDVTRERRIALIDELLSRQRIDGGWPENDQRRSDPYTTGQALYFLRKSGLPADHAALRYARDWLMATQLADGSWRAESHVKEKVQPWYDNGDPHGEHQYLSTPATAWATAGLAALLPDVPRAGSVNP